MGPANHERKSTWLVASSTLIWMALLALNYLAQVDMPQALPLLAVAQGLWLYRLYAVAHEASHYKLFPKNVAANDVCGSLAMIWVWAPITIFRQIHNFHHGANRRADGIATLDTFFTTGSRKLKWAFYAVWYFFAFCGGFFLHTLGSILLFLTLPQDLGKRISPAFNSWTVKKRLTSWIEFSASIGLHALLIASAGFGCWAWLLGIPILFFAWIWSAMLYIYHYKTTVGKKVNHNVRSLPNDLFFSWLLLNFNHHSVHHNDPSIPWHELPFQPNPQPESVRAQNDTVNSVAAAILQQLKGPRLVRRDDPHVPKAS